MKSWYRSPAKAISDHVRTVLVVDGSLPPNQGDLPVVTNGMAAFVAQRHENGDYMLALFGKEIPRDVVQVRPEAMLVAFFFFPFTLPATFGIPAQSLSKDRVLLDQWNAKKAASLVRNLAHVTKVADCVELLEQFLISQAESQQSDCAAIRYATDVIMKSPTNEVLKKVVSDLSMTERTFQRMFKKYVGITAAHYRRICQFDQSFLQVRTKDFQQLADIAYENGFSDQSHFNRAFKEFTDTTPGAYLESGLKP